MYDDGNFGGYDDKTPKYKKSKGRTVIVTAITVIVLMLLGGGIIKFVSDFNEYKRAYNQSQNATEETHGAGGTIEDSAKTEEIKPQPTEDKPILEAENVDDYEKDDSIFVAGNYDILEGASPKDVAKAVTDSVVCIENYQTVTYNANNFGFGFGFGFGVPNQGEQSSTIELAGEGSGVILSEDGYIVTNAHVIEGAELIKVMLSNNEIYQAELVGEDVDTDLALLKIDKSELEPISIGDSSELNVGEFVMAIGNPGGSTYANSVTLGIISAVNRQIDYVGNGYTLSMIQTDAAINPGNSGGALVDMNGNMIGICSMKYVDTRYEGMGFAISINEALPIINDLKLYGAVKNRSGLGIMGNAIDEVTASYYGLKEGIYVSKVTSATAGDLKAGDVITSIDGEEVKTMQNLKSILQNKTPGEEVEVTFYRSADEKDYTTKVILIELETNN